MNLKKQLEIQALYSSQARPDDELQGTPPVAPKKRGRPPKAKTPLVAPDKA